MWTVDNITSNDAQTRLAIVQREITLHRARLQELQKQIKRAEKLLAGLITQQQVLTRELTAPAEQFQPEPITLGDVFTEAVRAHRERQHTMWHLNPEPQLLQQQRTWMDHARLVALTVLGRDVED